MRPLYPFLAVITLGLSGLVLAACFLAVLFGMPLHGLLAAIVFSSFFVLSRELRAVARSRVPLGLRSRMTLLLPRRFTLGSGTGISGTVC